MAVKLKQAVQLNRLRQFSKLGSKPRGIEQHLQHPLGVRYFLFASTSVQFHRRDDIHPRFLYVPTTKHNAQFIASRHCSCRFIPELALELAYPVSSSLPLHPTSSLEISSRSFS